jgi:small subunit ribosomal protein S20
MATHKSALKQQRQSLERRQRNRQHRSRMRTAVKSLRSAVETGDADAARGLLASTLALVDRTVRHGAIHDNAAARTKSRLTRAVAKLGS